MAPLWSRWHFYYENWAQVPRSIIKSSKLNHPSRIEKDLHVSWCNTDHEAKQTATALPQRHFNRHCRKPPMLWSTPTIVVDRHRRGRLPPLPYEAPSPVTSFQTMNEPPQHPSDVIKCREASSPSISKSSGFQLSLLLPLIAIAVLEPPASSRLHPSGVEPSESVNAPAPFKA